MATQINTGFVDGVCYVELEGIAGWLEAHSEMSAGELVVLLREAGQLWNIEVNEFWSPNGPS